MSHDIERVLAIIDQATAVAEQTAEFTAGLSQADFLRDIVKQRATCMNLVIMGEAASEVIKDHPAFLVDHPDIAWRTLQDVRDQIMSQPATINPAALWMAAKDVTPKLLSQLHALRHIHAQGE